MIYCWVWPGWVPDSADKALHLISSVLHFDSVELSFEIPAQTRTVLFCPHIHLPPPSPQTHRRATWKVITLVCPYINTCRQVYFYFLLYIYKKFRSHPAVSRSQKDQNLSCLLTNLWAQVCKRGQIAPSFVVWTRSLKRHQDWLYVTCLIGVSEIVSENSEQIVRKWGENFKKGGRYRNCGPLMAQITFVAAKCRLFPALIEWEKQ